MSTAFPLQPGGLPVLPAFCSICCLYTVCCLLPMRAPCSSGVPSSLTWVAQDFHRSRILVFFLFQCKKNLLFELAPELQPSLNSSSVTSCMSFLQGESPAGLVNVTGPDSGLELLLPERATRRQHIFLPHTGYRRNQSLSRLCSSASGDSPTEPVSNPPPLTPHPPRPIPTPAKVSC